MTTVRTNNVPVSARDNLQTVINSNPQILAVSTSLKKAMADGRDSASRSLLAQTVAWLARSYPVAMLDLSTHSLPLFDGRMPADLDHTAVTEAHTAIAQAGGLLVAVPAYWSAVSASAKNFIEVLCGPSYDLADGAATVFTGKPVGLLIVGADTASTTAATAQAANMFSHVGAVMIDLVAVDNPRGGFGDINALSIRLAQMAARVALAARSR